MKTLADHMNETGAPRRQSWFETFREWGYFEEAADAPLGR